MKAIIMAGGEGKRLRPITCTMPKPMVPVLNKPIIDYTLELLKKHDITSVVLTLHYMADEIRKHIADGSAWGMNVEYSDPGIKLGTAGSVRRAISKADQRVIVLSGDGIMDIDLSEAIKAHEQSGAPATIVLKRVSEPTEYGIALMDDTGFITRFIEKPERSEVFSDYANTGIYILEPEALEMIPQDMDFDFSKQLFPRMQEAGMKLFGYVTYGYWCDIGDITQYKRAQQDMLDGKCKFETIAHCHGGIYIEPNARISGNARLIPPCYIGAGVQIGDGTLVEQYSVIGTGARINESCSIKRSIIFENVRVRGRSEIVGAVVCEGAEIDERVSIYEGSTVGANSRIGKNVIITQGAAIWPEKQIETGARCRDNIVWGNGSRKFEIIGSSATGYADTMLTPETVMRLSCAYAASLKNPSKLILSCDGSAASIMLKHAAIAGIVSQGTDVSQTGPLSVSAFRYSIGQFGVDGGVYISSAPHHMTKITFYDKNGFEADTETMRGIYHNYVLEQKPSTEHELGIISKIMGNEDAYEANLAKGADTVALKNNPRKLRIAAAELTARSIERFMLSMGWYVEAAQNADRLIPAHTDDTLCIFIDSNGAMSMALTADTIGDNNSILAVLAMDAADRGDNRRIVLPPSFPDAYVGVLAKHGADVRLTYENAGKRSRHAWEQGAYLPELFEPEAAVVKLCELFCRGLLMEYLKRLPPIFEAQNSVQVSWRDMGRMFRKLVETEKMQSDELIDGIRLKHDTGWVFVHPQNGMAAFRVISGSSDSEYASELCDIYIEKLKKLRDE